MIEVLDDKGERLATICRLTDFEEPNKVQWISDNKDGLQVAGMNVLCGRTFKTHQHIFRERSANFTEEAIVVIKGKLKSVIYDLQKQMQAEVILYPGDMIITRRGYHGYEVLEDGTIFYEMKNGPFSGVVSEDKTFLESENTK